MNNLIIHFLKAYYWLEIVSLELLTLGADFNASVYKAESVDHHVYFVKVRQGPIASMEVISLLEQAGVKEIISPIKTRKGEQMQQVDDAILIVYPFVEGQNGFNRSLSDQQWIQFGKTLKRVHQIDVPDALKKHIRVEDFSPKTREAVRALNYRLEFLKERKEVIEKLLERAERLSKKIATQEFPFVLCHSDIHAGNLLLENDNFYLIDWDDPIMAPKERDLMFIGGGVGNVWNSPREEELFYEGYGKTELNQVLLAFYRHERILVDIVEYVEWLQKEINPEAYQQFVAMFEPHGVVDIALQSDENLLK